MLAIVEDTEVISRYLEELPPIVNTDDYAFAKFGVNSEIIKTSNAVPLDTTVEGYHNNSHKYLLPSGIITSYCDPSSLPGITRYGVSILGIDSYRDDGSHTGEIQIHRSETNSGSPIQCEALIKTFDQDQIAPKIHINRTNEGTTVLLSTKITGLVDTEPLSIINSKLILGETHLPLDDPDFKSLITSLTINNSPKLAFALRQIPQALLSAITREEMLTDLTPWFNDNVKTIDFNGFTIPIKK